jgi:hypothetical protein
MLQWCCGAREQSQQRRLRGSAPHVYRLCTAYCTISHLLVFASDRNAIYAHMYRARRGCAAALLHGFLRLLIPPHLPTPTTPAGEDISREVATTASRVYLAARSWKNPAWAQDTAGIGPQANIFRRPMVAQLGAAGGATFTDGSSVEYIDAVIYCTGALRVRWGTWLCLGRTGCCTGVCVAVACMRHRASRHSCTYLPGCNHSLLTLCSCRLAVGASLKWLVLESLLIFCSC